METEIDIARQIASGTRQGVVQISTASWLVGLRISGTGVAYRSAHGEYVWRSPAIWLEPNMRARCAGLPVLANHPDNGVISGLDDFETSVVGTTLLGFVKGAELWGVVRLYDETLAEAIATGAVDTSPSVQFAPGGTSSVTLPEGATLIVEGNPRLLDHIGLVSRGVWSRGRQPSQNSIENTAVEQIDA